MTILEIALNIYTNKTFYYKTQTNSNIPKRGFRVLVPFLNKIILGIVLRVFFKSKFNLSKIKKINKILDYTPIFSDNLLSLLISSSKYYHYPIGKILFFALPKKFKKIKNIFNKNCLKKIAKEKKLNFYNYRNNNFKLKEKEKIKKIIKKKKFTVWVFTEIKNSIKIKIYIEIIKNILIKKKQILILVPEINLTYNILKNLKKIFKYNIEIWHSNLKKNKKFHIWIKTKIGLTSILIGTRSTLLNDFNNLGLIIVDEEHNDFYKEKKNWNYNARDLAILKAKKENIPIILTSNTLSLETILNIKNEKYNCINFNKKEKIICKKNLIEIKKEDDKNYISKKIIKKIKEHLNKKNKIILFLNKKGYSSILICTECKWKAKCYRCNCVYTIHKKYSYLHCVSCNYKKTIFNQCKNCGSIYLVSKGLGIEKLEKIIKKIFKNVKIIVIKNSVKCEKITPENYSIFIGTKKIFQNKYFPNVTLIILFNIDQILFSDNYKITEKFLQFYHQIIEKYSEKKTEIIFPTKYPKHKIFHHLLQKKYYQTANKILKERQEMNLPPYTNYIIIQSKSYKEENSLNFLKKIRKYIKKNDKINLIGPIKENKYKKKCLFRWKIILQHDSKYFLNIFFRKILLKIEKFPETKKVKWKIKLDP